MNNRGSNCYYNTGIICSGDDRPCAACGWNPEVEEARKAKMFAKPTGEVRYEPKTKEDAQKTWIVRWV